jgi:diguanylate cyclase (GGDEF)-like protein
MNLMTFAMMPHGSCFLWNRPLTGLHFSSDLIIALSYFSIPAMMFTARHQMNEEARSLSILFASFILSCGLGHISAAWNIWHTNYWLEGSIKLITAWVSAYTAFNLYQQIPVFFSIYKRLEASEEKLQTDALTGLPNRRAFLKYLKGLISTGDAEVINLDQVLEKAKYHALILADLDGFKLVNDNFGHPAGDRVLCEVARLLAKNTRSENTLVTRLGGDEFAIVVRCCDEDQILSITQRLRKVIQEYSESNEQAKTLGISMGFHLFTSESELETIEEIYSAADRALYHAKHSGKQAIAWMHHSASKPLDTSDFQLL